MSDTDQTFESRLQRLQKVVEQLEQGDIPLEESVQLFKEGLELSQICRKKLEQAKNEVKVYKNGLLEEFDSSAEPIAE